MDSTITVALIGLCGTIVAAFAGYGAGRRKQNIINEHELNKLINKKCPCDEVIGLKELAGKHEEELNEGDKHFAEIDIMLNTIEKTQQEMLKDIKVILSKIRY